MEMLKKILYLIAVFACCVLGGNVRIPAEKKAEDARKEAEPLPTLKDYSKED